MTDLLLKSQIVEKVVHMMSRSLHLDVGVHGLEDIASRLRLNSLSAINLFKKPRCLHHQGLLLCSMILYTKHDRN